MGAITRKAAKRREARAGAYRDGVQGERCQACGSLLRAAGGAPMVSVRLEDLEDVAILLDRLAERGDLIKAFEQGAGRTVALMKADRR